MLFVTQAIINCISPFLYDHPKNYHQILETIVGPNKYIAVVSGALGDEKKFTRAAANLDILDSYLKSYEYIGLSFTYLHTE